MVDAVPDLPYSHILALATIAGVQHLVLKPGEAERAAIAALGRLNAVHTFVAKIDVTPRADGTISLNGRLTAEIEPICVVTLEPFPRTVDEQIEAVFAEAQVIARLEKRAKEAELDFDPPDEIENGIIDAGALAVEFLMLALDPYPKKPGAVFGGHAEEVAKVSPFAALAALKEQK